MLSSPLPSRRRGIATRGQGLAIHPHGGAVCFSSLLVVVDSLFLEPFLSPLSSTKNLYMQSYSKVVLFMFRFTQHLIHVCHRAISLRDDVCVSKNHRKRCVATWASVPPTVPPASEGVKRSLAAPPGVGRGQGEKKPRETY